MKAKSVKVVCGHCGGTGWLPLPGWALPTLKAIPARGITAPQLADKLGMRATAVNGRLVALERWGLVLRAAADGKTFVWSRVKAEIGAHAGATPAPAKKADHDGR